MNLFSLSIPFFIIVATGMMEASASGSESAGIAFFESNIRPVLVKHCYECHSGETGKSKGGLRVDSRQALLRGGDSGPLLVPGDPEDSLLLIAIRHEDEDYAMPPKQALPEEAIADFERWILIGAPGPAENAVPDASPDTPIDVEQGREFWAYRPVIRREAPESRDAAWNAHVIDRWIHREHEEHGLEPAPEASPEILIRRLFFVLTGLPPSPETIRAWIPRLETKPAEGLGELVDFLLGSDRFGEHWGRHWLDVARFAESTGGDSNNLYQHAWRYRNYVIDCFNADKPFDRFLREQIAGDLLPIESDAEWAENLVATGFLALGVKLVGEEDGRMFAAEVVDEQIDTVTRAFLASTVACARCHDHKTDPVPQSDYYALAAIFRNTSTHFGLIRAQARQFTPLLDVSDLGLEPGNRTADEATLAALTEERESAWREMEEVMAKIRSGEHVNRSTLRRSRTARDKTEAALQAFDAEGKARVFVMGVQDRDLPLETRLLHRGELDRPGAVVEPGFVQVMSPPGHDRIGKFATLSGRRELADWMADPRHPLTARVLANRIWTWLMGRGLVTTPDDFGATGESPSHPELLDHLAIRVVENGWSVKRTIREIVLTRTWRQDSGFDETNFARDPDNRYLWRANPRRLEAEAIRDAMLTVSGNLVAVRPRGSLLEVAGEGAVGKSVFAPEIRAIETDHRAIFLPRVRDVMPELLELFDSPDGSTVTGQREVTTMPLQALYLMNSDFVREQAESFADRVMGQPPSERLDFAHLAAFGRPATEAERASAREFGRAFREGTPEASGEPGPEFERERWIAYCHALLCTAEFRRLE